MTGNGPPAPAGSAQASPDEAALAALRFGWGEAYRIGQDAARGWWATRRDGQGEEIRRGDPDALWQAIREDYGRRPVPRDQPSPGAES